MTGLADTVAGVVPKAICAGDVLEGNPFAVYHILDQHYVAAVVRSMAVEAHGWCSVLIAVMVADTVINRGPGVERNLVAVHAECIAVRLAQYLAVLAICIMGLMAGGAKDLTIFNIDVVLGYGLDSALQSVCESVSYRYRMVVLGSGAKGV